MRNTLVFYLSVIVVVLTFTNCANTGGSGLQTPSGYDYSYIDDQPGESGVVGDFLLFFFNVRSGDSILPNNLPPDQPSVIKIEEDLKMYGDFIPVAELLQTMSIGDSAILYYPQDSFSRPLPQGDQLANVLNYELKLVEIKDAEEYKSYQEEVQAELNAKIKATQERTPAIAEKVAEDLQKYKSNNFGNQLKETGSGLKYVIHEIGEVGTNPQRGETVNVNYYGVLADNGNMFDNSFRRGSPFSFLIGGRVISGWNEGVPLLNKGGSGTFFIPYQLGYGKGGNPPDIPSEAELVFYVELLK